ncbi:MAG: hypothetical protein HS132_18760 [Planctomycetia bacterium]|nr:hypothetical protein [Planctomycetia bacterium]
MQTGHPNPFTKLRWYRLPVLLLNIRLSSAMSAHPISVFQAIIKDVSARISPYPAATPLLQANAPASPLSERPAAPIDETKQVGDENAGEPSQGAYGREEEGMGSYLIFHVKGRRHNLRLRESEMIPLEIYFFKGGACIC